MTATHAANRLANESSPYLRQHAHNPVDWYPWGAEAFEKARREDKPVFLSIGYSSCHWCHVMERESFENESIAGLLNERFVSVKVDREERPDVDDVYMTFVQLTSGHGGWPLSAFLLADRRPFFGGTYFPPDDRQGRIGFRTLLTRMSETYRTRRADVEETAARMAEEIADAGRVAERHATGELNARLLDGLTAALARSFDATHGGFGRSPKFPPHTALEWLLGEGAKGKAEALAIATKTLDAMAFGGIHDHLGGGFHRYATDERWLLPHFEEMLSDNGQLLASYARAHAATGKDLYRRVAAGIGDYLIREMSGPPDGSSRPTGFYAATDADSEGEEGKFFVWSEAEIREVLGAEDAAFFGRVYQVRTRGNYHDESTGAATALNILHLAEEPSPEDETRLAPLRTKLLARRKGRVPPALDDKRISGWNALAVSGLAVAGRLLGEERFLDAAEQGARFLLETARDASGTLLRSWKDGAGSVPAFLEDEAYFANALLDLAEAVPACESEWTAEAGRAVASITRRFRRKGEAGFTFSGEGHEELLANGRDLFDKATPSGSASAARALLRLATRTGDRALAGEARAAIQEVSALMTRAPRGTESWHLALAELLAFEEAFGAAQEPASVSRASGALGAITVEATASPAAVKAGGETSVTLRIAVEEGSYLLAEGGLSVEALGGADLPLLETVLPQPSAIAHADGTSEPGYEKELAVTLRLAVRRGATPGERPLPLLVRFRSCGDGVCRPEALVALTLTIRVTS